MCVADTKAFCFIQIFSLQKAESQECFEEIFQAMGAFQQSCLEWQWAPSPANQFNSPTNQTNLLQKTTLCVMDWHYK